MSWASPNTPNVADFTSFVQGSMNIPPQVIPTDSPWLGWMLDRALGVVLSVPSVGIEYTIAVYNCAGHMLVAHYPAGTDNEVIQSLRKRFGLLDAAAGLVASSSDQGSAESLAVPAALGQLTIGDMAFYKTPWGREYLAYAQDFGGLWGLS